MESVALQARGRRRPRSRSCRLFSAVRQRAAAVWAAPVDTSPAGESLHRRPVVRRPRRSLRRRRRSCSLAVTPVRPPPRSSTAGPRSPPPGHTAAVGRPRWSGLTPGEHRALTWHLYQAHSGRGTSSRPHSGRGTTAVFWTDTRGAQSVDEAPLPGHTVAVGRPRWSGLTPAEHRALTWHLYQAHSGRGTSTRAHRGRGTTAVVWTDTGGAQSVDVAPLPGTQWPWHLHQGTQWPWDDRGGLD